MAEMTFNPDATPGVTCCDGRANRAGVDQLWTDIISGAGTDSRDTGATDVHVYFLASGTTNQWSGLYNGFIFFDTSGLPNNAVITGAVLSLYLNTKADPEGWAPDVCIYGTSSTSTTSIAAADFQTQLAVELSNKIAYGDVAAGYNAFTLIDVDADDFGYISKTGLSRFCLRNPNYQVADNPPAWASGVAADVRFYASEEGTIYRPKLVVTYSVPTVGRSFGLIIG